MKTHRWVKKILSPIYFYRDSKFNSGQIELINVTLKENNPEKIKLLIPENRKFYTDVIEAYEAKLLDEQKN